MAIRSRLRQGLWIALFAMFGLAAAPTVSRLALPSLDHCASLPAGHDMAAMAQMAGVTPHAPSHDPGATVDTAPSPSRPPASLEHCDLCGVAALACVTSSPPVQLDAAITSEAGPVVQRDESVDWRSEWSPSTWRGPPAAA